MAILDQNQIFFTPFEPKQSNRFIVTIDGIPGYIVKGVSAINMTQTAVALNHINIQRYVKGKTVWGTVSFTLYEPITPSGAQSVMEWVRLGHESVTGRDGYSDFYKKNITLNALGPVGDIVGEWIIQGAYIKTATFGEYDWANDAAINLSVTIAMDYCVLNF